jgi:hypothetical protein
MTIKLHSSAEEGAVWNGSCHKILEAYVNTFTPAGTVSVQIETLLERIKAYSFPGGEGNARDIRRIRTTQRGEIRSDPEARWVPFTAEEYVDAAKSGFCWVAHMGSGLKAVDVTDAYENGHGRLVLRKGPLQLKKLTGTDVDKGELQRYLAYLGYCPPMLVNNLSLEFNAVNPRVLRLCDRSDPTGASVDVEIEDNGCIAVTRAIRPRTVGKGVLMTPWSGLSTEMQELEGLRVPKRLEASWELPSGSFTYIRIELLSFELLR